MTKISKNVRVLLCALALSALTQGGAEAQSVVNPTPSPTPKPTATPTPKATPKPTATSAATATPKASSAPASTPTPTIYTNAYTRRLSLVTPEGAFKNEFTSIREAFEASQGNRYNQTLKKGSEIIVMNARCGEVPADKVTFSLYSLPDEIAPLVKSFLDYRPAAPKASDDLVQRERTLRLEESVRERALIDEVLRILTNSVFPRKADCDAVPVALSLLQRRMLRLEVDDTQSPLIGPKINDGFLYDTLMEKNLATRAGKGSNREFWEKYGYNHFSSLQDAGDAALLFPATKAIIFNGTNLSIYRLNYDSKFDAKAGVAQFDILKTTPIRKGWKILAVFYGNKFIRIDDTKVK